MSGSRSCTADSLCTATVRTAERPIRGRPRAGGEPNPRGRSGRRAAGGHYALGSLAAGGEAPDTTPPAADEVNWPIPLGRPVTHRFIRYEANDATRSTSNELMFIRLDVAVATRTNFDGKGATE